MQAKSILIFFFVIGMICFSMVHYSVNNWESPQQERERLDRLAEKNCKINPALMGCDDHSYN